MDALISVIVPHYNDAARLQKLIQSFLACAWQELAELIIVDDASDSTPQIPLSQGNIRLICLDKNRGPAHARNIGAKEAQAKLLLFTDSDVRLLPAAIETAIKTLNNPKTVAFTAKAAFDHTETRYFVRFKNYLEKFWMPLGNTSTVADTKFFGIYKSKFDHLGGFDSTYTQALVEDYEFSYRMAAHHKEIAFVNADLFIHDHGTLSGFCKKTYRRVPEWMMLKKKYGIRFDNFGTSVNMAFTLTFSLLFLLSIPLLFVARHSYLLFIASLGLHYSFTSEFRTMLFKNRESTRFLLYCYVLLHLISIPVAAGAVKGIMKLLLTKKDSTNSVD